MEIRKAVREAYGNVAKSDGMGCCGGSNTSPDCCQPQQSVPCCGPGLERSGGSNLNVNIGKEEREREKYSAELGYSEKDIAAVPQGANLGLGCGCPKDYASLAHGEKVLDLGSGGGFDCFLAAKEVGETGKVIGVDMTPQMVEKARGNAERSNVSNVEFRLGEIEHLPVEDSLVDVVMSNCVINLSPEKEKVFAEAFRVLKPGGRLAVSDIVAVAEIPKDMKSDLAMHSACVSGAAPIQDVENMLREVGFTSVSVVPVGKSVDFMRNWVPSRNISDYVVSSKITAVKPPS